MAVIIELTDTSLPELQLFANLTAQEARTAWELQHHIFLAESLTVAKLAIGAGCCPLAFLMERRQIEGAAELLELCGEVPVYTGDRELLASLTGYVLHRGILCALERPKFLPAETVCRNARRIAVLEDLTDTTNLGAIFRSAAALGMDAILLSPSCGDPLSRRTVRVGMGSVFQVPWTILPEWPCDLHRLGFETVGVSFDGEPGEVPSAPPLAVLLRSNGETLIPSAISHDHTLSIPLHRGLDSLNVVTGAAVVFWELHNQ